MKKYIQPSLKVREIYIETALMGLSNGDETTPGNPNETIGGGLSNEHRGWNLWGVED